MTRSPVWTADFRTDFEDEEFSTTPIPFGRPAGGAFGFGGSSSAFGHGGGSSSASASAAGFGFGGDSPTATTPMPSATGSERHGYFSSHARTDSEQSADSTSSATTRFPLPSGRTTPFAHSSQSSIATTSTSPFTKKSSFASIRNAFKGGKDKDKDAPPVPPLDYQAYPVLKNPFNRSN
jgi:hypothetical protein